MPDDIKVQVLGLRETLKALDRMDSRARRATREELGEVADRVAVTGRSLVNQRGLSGWKRWKGGYNPRVIQSGIKVTTVTMKRQGTYERSYVAVVNSTAAGAIWEVAGRTSKGRLPRRRTKSGRVIGKLGNGRAFVAAINERDGKASRTVWRAFDRLNVTYIRERFWNAMAREARIAQAKIDRAS